MKTNYALKKTSRATGYRLVLAAVFMLAQFISFSHASAYGGTQHTHDGQPCIINATCSKIQQLTLTPELVLAPEPTKQIFLRAALPVVSLAVKTPSAPIRAPPAA